MAITSGYEMTFEMFPTSIRAQGGAWASSLANISAFMAPYVPYSVSDKASERIGMSLKTKLSFIVGHTVPCNAILHTLWMCTGSVDHCPVLARDWG